jgi:hypothetical protein
VIVGRTDFVPLIMRQLPFNHVRRKSILIENGARRATKPMDGGSRMIRSHAGLCLLANYTDCRHGDCLTPAIETPVRLPLRDPPPTLRLTPRRSPARFNLGDRPEDARLSRFMLPH